MGLVEFTLRFSRLTRSDEPDPLRIFVVLGNGDTVHEVDPRGPGVWGGAGRWSKRTLCRRRLHVAGTAGPRLSGPSHLGASCPTCRERGAELAVLCGLVRWGEALAGRASIEKPWRQAWR